MKFFQTVLVLSFLAFIMLVPNVDRAVALQKDKPVRATADIGGCTPDSKVYGIANLREKPTEEGIKQVRVTLFVKGLPPGKHAVHIHETGICEETASCTTAGGHFDPGPNGNPSPDGNHPFHSGDLINIDVNQFGFGILSTNTTRVTLSEGPLSIFDDNGSAFIIHVNPDTYCPDGAEAGCAGGARAACGIIEPKD